jgi:hypothetical protein
VTGLLAYLAGSAVTVIGLLAVAAWLDGRLDRGTTLPTPPQRPGRPEWIA